MINATQSVDTHEMVVVHRVFRRELRMLPDLILGVPHGDRARAAVVAEHLSDMTHALHHHHTAEDTLLWPVLLRRIGDNPLVPRMQRQHEQLAALLDQVDKLTPRWRDAADAATGRELAHTIGQVSAALAEHLHDEEHDILPLVARHVTHQEWQALGEYGRRVIPKNSKAFVFVGLVLEEADQAERDAFLSQMPAPIRWAWRLAGDRVYRKAMAKIRGSAGR
ncbi:MAG TPA: hemerythrin domain-containing protein [Micromonosporaceae bacterium]